MATPIHIPLGCIVLGAILGHLPPAGSHQWVACWPVHVPLRGPPGLLKRVLLIEGAGTKVLSHVAMPQRPRPATEVVGRRAVVPWVWHPRVSYGVSGLLWSAVERPLTSQHAGAVRGHQVKPYHKLVTYILLKHIILYMNIKPFSQTWVTPFHGLLTISRLK